MTQTTCTVLGCEKKPFAIGLCSMHYSRQYRSGSVGAAESHGPGPKRKPYATITCQHCGKDFEARRFVVRDGHVRSSGFRKQRYCGGTCRNLARATKRKVDKYGYVYTYRPGSTKRQRTQVYEHRLVMERMIGRELTERETVHHKNGNRSDNRPENLELWASRHGRGQRVTDAVPMWKVGAAYLEGVLRQKGELLPLSN